ncbi:MULTISPECIES: hypothetical protein [unclassified Carboxylicivirga]|uniref:hypothetical protein n=1 Tax=Carboxylicivirga TaxID=1628153 RepID=UPI003D3477F1
MSHPEGETADAETLKIDTEALAGTIRHALLPTRDDEHRWTWSSMLGCSINDEGNS